MNDLIAELERVRRAVGSQTAADGPAHVVELRRVYDAPVADVWDVCTNPERIPRWFLPVAGDLRLGGRFQLEGNAGGEITECQPPRRLAVTWEFGGDVSLVTVDLAPVEDGTELRLRHVVGDNDHWATYGPGAVGVGWELALLGLALHLRTGASADEARDFASGAEGQAFMRRSAAEWGAAHAASGAPDETASEAAARTSAAYAPDPGRVGEPAPSHVAPRAGAAGPSPRSSGWPEGGDVAKERGRRIGGLLGLRPRLAVRARRARGTEAGSRELGDRPLARGRLADEPVLVGGRLSVERRGAGGGFVARHEHRVGVSRRRAGGLA